MVVQSSRPDQIAGAGHARYAADILVIEDDVEHLKLLTELLNREQYHVRPTRTSKDGFRAAQLLRPDLIAMDISLPDGDGYTLCRTLRQDPELSEVPIIFISGLTDVESQVKGFEAGARDYITKPFEEIVVLRRVQNQLDIQRLQRQQREYAQIEERHRIARDLHDSVNQTLFLLGATAESLRLTNREITPALDDKLRSLHELSKAALEEMRLLLFELVPETMHSTTLAELLGRVTGALSLQTAATFSVDVHEDEAIEHDLERKVALYRIAQEAVHNAVRHAGASRIDIHMDCLEDEGWLSVEDDGEGFDVSGIEQTGMGLNNMRMRALQAKLTIEIESAKGNGTRIVARWTKRGQ